ncbi:nitroreductase [Lucifera butyrica]|uniref:Nitroreductase n=1 Tax=Lucifera butyrica TaxID=1351585 RepID=A0A498R651_9FIRM|nr:nitroreductase family protein [Lucifera butyrica]VBB06944.1 nitroreductase [Lucifera butyrica]
MDSIMSHIVNRRSVRAYTAKKVDRNDILTMLTAASWAPSGNNLQPWKFCVIMEDAELIKNLASLTVYQNWVKDAACLIAVFLDARALDNNIPDIYIKHVQAIGAAIQNMLLVAHGLGLGTCWIGEILKNADKVRDLLNIAADLQLMAVLSVGYPGKDPKSRRKIVSENIVGWF